MKEIVILYQFCHKWDDQAIMIKIHLQHKYAEQSLTYTLHHLQSDSLDSTKLTFLHFLCGSKVGVGHAFLVIVQILPVANELPTTTPGT